MRNMGVGTGGVDCSLGFFLGPVGILEKTSFVFLALKKFVFFSRTGDCLVH